MVTIGILKMFQGIPLAALCLLAVALSAVSVSAVQLHGIFTDHMVLQREIAMPVWGWAEPGEKLTVEFGGQRLETTADREGKWSVKLAPMKANSSPQELIVSGKNTLRLTDVLVGDVWLCSGQSNMELRLGDCRSQQDIDLADFPGIRAITLPLICAERPQANIRDEGRRWVVCSRESAAGISGVGFYFARRIHRQTGVPIGLLVSSVGGTNIEKWMPREAFDGDPALAEISRTLDRAVVEYRQDVSNSLAGIEAWLPIARASLAEDKPLPDAPEVFKHPFMPGSRLGGYWVHLYNGMIAPLTNFPIRGALWYQGENNGEEEDSYEAKMKALIASWRKHWGYEFPFYYVQLSSWQKSTDIPSGEENQGHWQKCRMAQFRVLKSPKTGMAVTIDVGDAEDIHPRNKFDVGERLALWALANEYGEKLEPSGPLFRELKVQGNQAQLYFDHLGQGLMVASKSGRDPAKATPGVTLKRFAIAGVDKKWHWAEARIDGERVICSHPDVPAPVAVRYAWAINPEGANLYNRDGLPASPFRTDNW